VPVDLQASIDQNQEVLDYTNAYQTKVPDYFRIDIGVSYRKNLPTWSWVLSLDIQNVTGRLNVYNEYYSTERMVVDYNYMNGLIPILNYRVEF
jgi:outer membrane receptor protein involved in Fe transport